ncbi:MAG: hypothetical protein QOG75_5619 [Mycobacterium sp.]|nr:hypothetical protein [Mycobacterium sp.]
MTLFTESGLDGQYLPSPLERLRKQAATYRSWCWSLLRRTDAVLSSGRGYRAVPAGTSADGLNSWSAQWNRRPHQSVRGAHAHASISPATIRRALEAATGMALVLAG